ncbi:MAG: hypothetical protein Q9219_002154 [cf. Caloplaca sp. 3 TL-2023]
MGYQPVIDSYESVTGLDWTSRKEVLAWGAGAELFIRVNWMGPDVEEEWQSALRTKASLTDFDEHHHKSRWWRIKDPSHREGQDDITAIQLLRKSQIPVGGCEYIIVGRASGELGMLSINWEARDTWKTETRFMTDGESIRSASVNSAIPPLLAACVADQAVAIYATFTGNESVSPLGRIQIDSSENPCRIWSVRFLRQDRLALGLGPSVEPVKVYEVRHDSVPSQPIRRFPMHERYSIGGPVRGTVHPLVALPRSSPGALEGDLFLSGGSDGIIRLHDLRSSEPYVAAFTDLVDHFSTIYSLLPLGRGRFLAGGSNHSLLKVFEMGEVVEDLCCYNNLDHASATHECSVIADPNSAYLDRGRRNPRAWNVFLTDKGANGKNRSHTQSLSVSPVYSISSPSLFSPRIFAGVEGQVIQMDITSVYDHYPDPIFKYGPKRTGQEYRDAANKWDPCRDNFVPLPRERIHFTSPPRTTFQLQTPNSYPGKEPLSISSGGGTAFVTNQRIVYLPSTPTAQLRSFSAPILNLQDTHVDAPFFGANSWTGIVKPVSGGNIPPHHAFVKLSMTFKDGGAFDFASTYERIKETAAQAVEVARESGRQQGPDLSDINLEQLPAYEEIGSTASAPPAPPLQQPIPITPIASAYTPQRDSGVALSTQDEGNPKPSSVPASDQQYPPPDEPPPGYEEVQQNSVAENLERNLRNSR